MTPLDIIDTVVKIGLGATISGVATFYVSKNQHRHEIHKSRIGAKLELLKECAFKMDKSSTIRNSAENSIQRKRLGSSVAGIISIEEELILLNDSYNLLKEARVLSQLSGENDLTDIFNLYQKEVSEKKNHFVIHGLEFDVEFINIKTAACENFSAEILRKLGEALGALHA